MTDFRIEDFNFAKYNTRRPQEILLNVCKEGNVQVINWLIENNPGLKIDSNVFLIQCSSFLHIEAKHTVGLLFIYIIHYLFFIIVFSYRHCSRYTI